MAVERSFDQAALNERIASVLGPDVAEYTLGDAAIFLLDGKDFMLIDIADLGERTPQSAPFYAVLYFQPGAANLVEFIRTLARELRLSGHAATPVRWRVEGNAALDRLVKRTLRGHRTVTLQAGREYVEFTSAETEALLGGL